MSASGLFAPLLPDIARGFREQRAAAVHVMSYGPFTVDPDAKSACVVYVATNKANGDIYVGLTSRGIAARRYQHFWRARHGQAGKFSAAIRKYGEHAFAFTPIRECKDFFDGLRREAWAIADLRPEYNLTAGGGGIKGFKFSPETVARLAEGRRGRKGAPCPEWLKDKNAALRRAERGKPRSDRAQAAVLGNVKKAQLANRRSVTCTTDGRRFDSLKEAAAAYGLTTGQVSYYCGGDHRSRRGLQFRYEDAAS